MGSVNIRTVHNFNPPVVCLAPAMLLSCPNESVSFVAQRTGLFIFGTFIQNVALRDP